MKLHSLAFLALLAVLPAFSEPVQMVRLKVEVHLPRKLSGYDSSGNPIYVQKSYIAGYQFIPRAEVVKRRGSGFDDYSTGAQLFTVPQPIPNGGFDGYTSYHLDGVWWYDNGFTTPLFKSSTGNFNGSTGGGSQSNPYHQNGWNDDRVQTQAPPPPSGYPPSAVPPVAPPSYDNDDGLYTPIFTDLAPILGGDGFTTQSSQGGEPLEWETPITYWNGSNFQTGYYNPFSNTFQSTPYTPPETGGGSGSADLSRIESDLSGLRLEARTGIESIRADNSGYTQRLVDALASHLGNWVRDSSLTLDRLERIATDIHLDTSALKNKPDPVINVEPPVVNVAAPVVNVEAPDLSAVVSAVNAGSAAIVEAVSSSGGSSGGSSGSSDATIDQSTPLPPLPELDNDPIELPEENQRQVDTLNGWIDSKEKLNLPLQAVQSGLTALAGRIPSVGFRDEWFTADFDIPYAGHFTKHFTWSDWPSASLIRPFLVFCVFLFFFFKVYHLIVKVIS